MFQIKKGSCQWLLRYEYLKTVVKLQSVAPMSTPTSDNNSSLYFRTDDLQTERTYTSMIITVTIILIIIIEHYRLRMYENNNVNTASNRWMDDLRFYVLFNSISVISGRWADDNERLCAEESRLQLRRFRLEWARTVRTARSVGQRLTH